MSKHKNNNLEMDELEQLIYDAMRHCGMIPPMMIDEVAALEAELPDMKLPFGPSDPFELLTRLELTDPVEDSAVLPFPRVANETARNLARAAREGGTLSAEVERRMAEDKAKHLQRDNDNQ